MEGRVGSGYYKISKIHKQPMVSSNKSDIFFSPPKWFWYKPVLTHFTTLITFNSATTSFDYKVCFKFTLCVL